MMATEMVPGLPAIKSVQAPPKSIRPEPGEPELRTSEPEKKDDDDTRHRKAASFMARVRLGSVQKQPRPGDVYRPRISTELSTTKQQRPLGLIPDRRERMSLLTELTRLFAPVPAGLSAPPTVPKIQLSQGSLPRISQGEEESVTVPTQGIEEQKMNKEETNSANNNTPIAATLKWCKDVVKKKEETSYDPPIIGPSASTALLGTESLSPYRLHCYGMKELGHQAAENDPDYLEIFSKCNIKDYYSTLENKTRVHQVQQMNGISSKRSHTLPLVNSQWSGNPRMTTVLQLSQSKKATQLSDRIDFRSSTVGYVTFSGQAKLWNKSLSDGRREALGYEPCERCRLRGGRCSKCKAIRTGGGYIILDGNDLSDEDLQRKYRNGFGDGDGYCYGHGADRDRGLNRYGQHGDQDRAGVGGSGEGLLTDGDSDHHLQGSTGLGLRKGTGRRVDRDGSKGHGTGGDDDLDGDGRLGKSQDGRLKAATGLESTLGGDDESRGRDGSGTGLGLDGSTSNDGLTLNGDQDDTGRYSNMSGRLGSRQSGSRPASTLGNRPGSSLRKFGSRGSSRRDKMRRNIGVEKKQRGRGTGEDSDDGGGSDGEGGGRRSRRRRGHGEGSDEEDDGKDRADFKFNSGRRETEEDEGDGSYANLMRFKRKRDDVKALHATMNELQGIDPLDYLARYCIIDQSKLPHYQHAYDNVDRDEDDEIDISELDFALKTVNYDLITDAEMNYVHSVLELAGRYKLNFRLFSLIAALSEKVVSLEDMVKRLINKMDFEALEVKMKKCKELFYLLADTESSDNEGGVVTTSSLAVELQAGGLTQEHVEFVVDRLNHEEKGIVEFLDYLTYVPLFVEIHDTISGNPLDFSRTK